MLLMPRTMGFPATNVLREKNTILKFVFLKVKMRERMGTIQQMKRKILNHMMRNRSHNWIPEILLFYHGYLDFIIFSSKE